MDSIELTLNENKGFTSTNQAQTLHLDLEREEKFLPVDNLQGKIDAYEQYLKEKDACNKYRLVFTIHPYCTNILFNHITEAVYKEGSQNAQLVKKESDIVNFPNIGYYASYKEGCEIDANSPITRDTGYSCDNFSNAIQKEYLNYNCGIDIFNNHLLRKKEFVCINRPKTGSHDKYFNTIFDSVRDPWGETIEGLTWLSYKSTDNTPLHLYNKDNIYSFKDSITHNLREENGWLGFYNKTILSVSPREAPVIKQPEIHGTVKFGGTINFNDVINSGEIEQGNIPSIEETPSTDDLQNTIDDTKMVEKINRVLNNVEPCAFIDMYPTRQHYSFVPHFNKYRRRVENNWDYVLTYPYENVYDTPLTYDSSKKIYGILCDLVLNDNTSIKQLLDLDNENPIDGPLSVLFKTHLKHTLLPGDRVTLHIYNKKGNSNPEIEGKIYTLDNLVVGSIGKNGYDGQHYFSLRLNDVSTDIELAYLENVGSEDKENPIECRVEKMSADATCRYYIRKFKKLPNFKNTSINVSDGVSEAEINEALRTRDFSSSLNKLGFSKTIYGDDIAQIVFDDDIDISGLRDNFGRPLSVLYLTLIKTNKGHKEWYKDENYSSDAVEFSHCFGKVTSGFDLPVDVTNNLECNVRRQHNVTGNAKANNNIQDSSNFIEDNITNNGTYDSTISDYTYEFYGDIVEFDTVTLEEHVIERIYHRFNTAQREFSDGKKKLPNDTISQNDNYFSHLMIDKIIRDDYTEQIIRNGYTEDGFSGNTEDMMCGWANIAPEGYYYRPHYPVVIKEYSPTVNTGYHTQINFTYDESGTSTANTIVTDTNYYLETNTQLFMFHKDKNNHHKYIVRVGEVSGDNFTTVELILPDLEDTNLNNYILFKPNVLKPEGAYDFSDLEPDFVEKTGRYIWRDVLLSSEITRDSDLYDLMFTNGAIYIHKNINFYLKRQDPYGEYGLHPIGPPEGGQCAGIYPWELEFDGNEKNVSEGDYFEPGENNIC